MLKNKRLLIGIFTMLLLITMPIIVNAANETYTAQTTINGITANWSYKLNESNQIEDLKCTNVGDLSGSIAIPSKIEEKTVVSIGNAAFKGATGITEVVIPSSVKKIGYSAFENCTSLSKVNLGSIESISFDVFKGCTSLKSITIPKTLKDVGSGSVFTNCSNLTSITFEEGITEIPAYLCATTGITEITIPYSVKSIGTSAFSDCSELRKITILDNVEYMGGYNTSSDTVFTNHNEDLTIYCYKDSVAASYAISNKIKYVYLERPSAGNNEGNDENKQNNPNSEDNKTDTKKDTTVAPGSMPYTGGTFALVVGTITVVGIGIYAYKRNNDLKGI